MPVQGKMEFPYHIRLLSKYGAKSSEDKASFSHFNPTQHEIERKCRLLVWGCEDAVERFGIKLSNNDGNKFYAPILLNNGRGGIILFSYFPHKDYF